MFWRRIFEGRPAANLHQLLVTGMPPRVALVHTGALAFFVTSILCYVDAFASW